MNLDRAAFEQIYHALGKSRDSLLGDFGDTNKYPGALLKLESTLARLRQATMFHDDDGADGLLAYQTEDPTKFGVFDGVLQEVDHDAPEFEDPGMANWYPRYNGVPSLEGWGIWDYNAWSSWDVDPQPGNTEGGSYALRSNFTRPKRWDGSTHQDVPYFRHGRWISLFNEVSSGHAHNGGWFEFAVPKNHFEGCMLFDATTDTPVDVRIFAYSEMVQTKTNGSWDAITLPSYGDLGMVLDMGIKSVLDNYIFTINVPSYPTIDWPDGHYIHLAFYFGTQEELSLVPISGPPPSLPIQIPNQVVVWAKKNFFRQDVGVQFHWELESIYGTNTYLKAQNRTHFQFYDGEYTNPPVPTKYKLLDWPAATPAGHIASLTGYLRDIRPGGARAIRLQVRTQKSAYETPDVIPIVSVGPEITAEFWPLDWDQCAYFPPQSDGYETIGRIIVVRPPGDVYDIVDQRDSGFRGALESASEQDDADSEDVSSLNCKFYIAWMSQDIPSFALPPMNDPDAVERLLFSLYSALVELRLYSVDTPLSSLAYGLLPPGLYLPNSLLTGLSNLRSTSSVSSKAFAAALKTPTNSLLHPDTGYTGFDFDASERRIVEDIATKPPSTVMARLDSNVLSITGEKLNVSNTFEVFMDESDQCDAITLDSSADRLSNDYTLRLKLQDGNENAFQKDLYVSASKYFLSDEEYSRRVTAGLSTIGYFKQSTLTHMNEFRLHGYAGVIPDLHMRDYRTILTRVVSPPDETKVTEEQFRKNLENQGYTQEQIDEAVLLFLDSGGEFLVINLNQYDNKFNSLDELGICVSKLASYDISYWTDNLNQFFAYNAASNPDSIAPEIARSDAFTIAPAGLALPLLESYGNQVVLVADTNLNRTTNTGHEIPLITSSNAIKFTTTEASSISGFNLRVRKSAFDSNTGFTNSPGAGLRARLYTSENGVPGTLLATGGLVTYDNIPNTDFVERSFSLQFDLSANKIYWLVLEQVESPSWGFVAIDSKSEPTTPTAWQYDAGKSPANWTATSGTPWLKAYNSDVVTVTPIFDYTTDVHYDEFLVYDKLAVKIIIPSDTDRISFALSAILQNENPYATLLNSNGKRVRLRIVDDVVNFPSSTEVSTAAGPEIQALTTSYVEYKFELDSVLPAGTYWAEIYTDETPRGGWIATPRTGTTTGMLARQNPDATWIAESSDVWLKFYTQTYAVLGAFNRDTPNITEHLPPPNDQRTYIGVNQKSAVYKVDSFWSYTSKSLAEPAVLSIYPRAFYNPNTMEWEYASRTKNAYVKVKLWVDGRVVDKDIIHLSPAPGWRTQFWTKNIGDEKDIVTSDTPVIDTIVETINYSNYEGESGELGQHWNARFEGYFRPLYDGEVHTLVVSANTGVRVYFEDSTTPVIDTWDSPVYIPVSYTIPGPLSQSVAYKIIVEHYRDASTEELKLYWYPSSNPIPELLGPDTALVEPPSAVSLGPELADGIAYLAVAKTQEELETFTDGAPPGDVLVIRSS